MPLIRMSVNGFAINETNAVEPDRSRKYAWRYLPTGTKYERGTNRVGASRLFDLSVSLVCPSVFLRRFEQPTTPIEKENDVIHLVKPETIELVEAYYKVENPQVRRQILSTIRSFVRRLNDCGRNRVAA